MAEQEEKRRQREAARQQKQQEKEGARVTTKSRPDDQDIEWEGLVLKWKENGLLPHDADEIKEKDCIKMGLSRPQFPPAALQLAPFFPAQLGDANGGELVGAWLCLHQFSDVLGLTAFTLCELVDAFRIGEDSRLLGEVHVNLMRVLLADMEDAHLLELKEREKAVRAGGRGGNWENVVAGDRQEVVVEEGALGSLAAAGGWSDGRKLLDYSLLFAPPSPQLSPLTHKHTYSPPCRAPTRPSSCRPWCTTRTC